MAEDRAAPDVEQFVIEYIDSVPHLEALLLLWRSRPRLWTTEELAKSLYLQSHRAESIAQDLTRVGFVTATADKYQYASDAGEKDRVIGAVDHAYRRETVRLSTLLHARGSRALRDFAQSFQLKKKKE
jgi:hypothetical protein